MYLFNYILIQLYTYSTIYIGQYIYKQGNNYIFNIKLYYNYDGRLYLEGKLQKKTYVIYR